MLLTVKFPKINDDLIKSAYSYEIDPIVNKKRQKDRPELFEGYKVRAVDMGCRKKDEKIAEWRKEREAPEVLCVTGIEVEDGESIRMKAGSYTCGCVPEKCEKSEEDCKLLERQSCNHQFILPNDVYSYMFHRKEEILRSFRRAEEL